MHQKAPAFIAVLKTHRFFLHLALQIPAALPLPLPAFILLDFLKAVEYLGSGPVQLIEARALHCQRQPHRSDSSSHVLLFIYLFYFSNLYCVHARHLEPSQLLLMHVMDLKHCISNYFCSVLGSTHSRQLFHGFCGRGAQRDGEAEYSEEQG